jgi:NAD(P)-dependent dehydrogenase (short-subunit alcohol dehydrogenase family)
MTQRPLHDLIAVVTGGSRGAGRGIALELGAAGATVYVTARSTRAAPGTGYERFLSLLDMTTPPGTIEDTAEEVSRLGGRGIPVRCDHTDEAQVAALFRRVSAEHGGRLDLLVNNAWGGHQDPAHIVRPFWELPTTFWEGMFHAGVRNHVLAAKYAAPLMIAKKRGLVVTVTFWDRNRYTGHFYYDLAKASMTRLSFGIAHDLRPHGVAAVAVSPGWMRTEFVLAGHHTDEARWRDVPALAGTESPRYVGRAVVALARDSAVMEKSGKVFRVGDLALEYEFTDVDGRKVPPFELPASGAQAEAEPDGRR